jgi:hypothetical protein
VEDLREGNQKRGPEAENGTVMHKLDENGVLNKKASSRRAIWF